MKVKTYLACIVFQICIFVGSLQAAGVEKLVIIGSGPAGSSAAIFAGQANLKPLVIQDVDCNSQMALIHKIDNYPGVLEEVDGIQLLNKFREQAQRFGARFQEGSLARIDLLNHPFTLELESGEILLTESIIIAAGTQKKWLGLPSEEALKGKGVVSATFCRDLDFSNLRVVVVGGGHAALQEAHYIAERAKEVIIVNRSNKFNASLFHQQQVFDHEKIDIIYDTEVVDILDPKKNKVSAIVLRNRHTGVETTMAADSILVAIGNAPNSELFKNQLKMLPTGQIVINGKNTSTNIPGVFAAGDITDVSYGRVVIAAGAGGMAAMDVLRYLDSKK